MKWKSVRLLVALILAASFLSPVGHAEEMSFTIPPPNENSGGDSLIEDGFAGQSDNREPGLEEAEKRLCEASGDLERRYWSLVVIEKEAERLRSRIREVKLRTRMQQSEAARLSPHPGKSGIEFAMPGLRLQIEGLKALLREVRRINAWHWDGDTGLRGVKARLAMAEQTIFMLSKTAERYERIRSRTVNVVELHIKKQLRQLKREFIRLHNQFAALEVLEVKI